MIRQSFNDGWSIVKAGGFFDRLVETCPMRLTSNNAPGAAT